MPVILFLRRLRLGRSRFKDSSGKYFERPPSAKKKKKKQSKMD
jgi:hypothetical protein